MSVYQEILKSSEEQRKDEIERDKEKTNNQALEQSHKLWMQVPVTKEVHDNLKCHYYRLCTSAHEAANRGESETKINAILIEAHTLCKVVNLMIYGKYSVVIS